MTRVRRRFVPRWSSWRQQESGQITLLVIGYFAIAALVMTVATDASAVFLAQRSLASAADGAAAVAAQSVDERSLYIRDYTDTLPISDEALQAVVADYVEQQGLRERFGTLEVLRASATDPRTVTVTFRTTVRLPFVNVVTGEHGGGVQLTATAHAQMPLRN